MLFKTTQLAKITEICGNFFAVANMITIQDFHGIGAIQTDSEEILPSFCSPEERELIDEIAFSIFLDEPRIFGVKALQSSLYIPNIGFTLCYNDGCVVSEKVFIKNKPTMEMIFLR